MIHGNDGGDSESPNNDNDFDDATQIISDEPSTPDDATKIMPLRSGISPSADPQENVIGTAQIEDNDATADNNSATPDNDAGAGDNDDDAKTVFLPAGASKSAEENFDPAVGWLVITDGPGRGSYCSVFYGQNSVGRGADQRIQLNFGDTRIARDTHAYIIYDDVSRTFHLRDTGKANLVRLNNAPVMTPMVLNDRDLIMIGETTLMFVALCGESFDWLSSKDDQNSQSDK